MKKITKFDFEDGRGEVPAHQHVNKNGDVGGWVEDNCTVSEYSYISEAAKVYNNSRVYNSRVYNSRVLDGSSVYNSHVDNSHVDGSSVYNSRVDGSSVYNSSVLNGSSVYNSSVLNGSRVDNSRVYNAKITQTKQVYTQSPIGSRNDRCTATIDENGEIRIVAGCFSGTLDEFQKAVIETHGHSNYGKEYLAFIENAKTSFKIWGFLK